MPYNPYQNTLLARRFLVQWSFSCWPHLTINTSSRFSMGNNITHDSHFHLLSKVPFNVVGDSFDVYKPRWQSFFARLWCCCHRSVIVANIVVVVLFVIAGTSIRILTSSGLANDQDSVSYQDSRTMDWKETYLPIIAPALLEACVDINGPWDTLSR